MKKAKLDIRELTPPEYDYMIAAVMGAALGRFFLERASEQVNPCPRCGSNLVSVISGCPWCGEDDDERL